MIERACLVVELYSSDADAVSHLDSIHETISKLKRMNTLDKICHEYACRPDIEAALKDFLYSPTYSRLREYLWACSTYSTSYLRLGDKIRLGRSSAEYRVDGISIEYRIATTAEGRIVEYNDVTWINGREHPLERPTYYASSRIRSIVRESLFWGR